MNEEKTTENVSSENSFLIKEALTGAFIGIIMMIITFLVVHYVFDIKAFS
ncbi:hypothetical protein ACJ2A9_21710 [Anaerobacillus sp. MEB173]